MLKASNLHKKLAGRAVLRGVAIECGPAGVVIVSGPNGCGKSTLLRILCGLLEPDRGEIELRGFSLRREPARAKAHLGYAPDGLEPLPDLRVSEFLSLVRALKAAPDGAPGALDDSWCTRFGVSALLGQRLASLSFGQRKRVTLVAALVGAPWLLLLDEPSNGLDGTGVAAIHDLVAERRARSLATVLSTNDLEFASALEPPTKHYRIDDGQLVP